MFINFTNHPSEKWSVQQINASVIYGEIRDIPFPNIRSELTEAEVERLGEEYVLMITDLHPTAVLCQGEFTLCFFIICRLQEKGIRVFSACSERAVSEKVTDGGGTERISVFHFVKYREYYSFHSK